MRAARESFHLAAAEALTVLIGCHRSPSVLLPVCLDRPLPLIKGEKSHFRRIRMERESGREGG